MQTLARRPLIDRILPAPVDSGFRIAGYYVWCGSVLFIDGVYHLFASRWPKSARFPEGYRSHSEIVHATSPSPTGPYEFAGVSLAGRGGVWWDGCMCHNPKIFQVGGRLVLYYIGARSPGGPRKIGYATAFSPYGPWERLPEPLALTSDANNPAPLLLDDGSVVMAFRDEQLQMHIAIADSYRSPYRIVARNIFPKGRLEDPDLSCIDGEYHIVAEDNEGCLTGTERFGGHLVSRDLESWQTAHPHTVYTHRVHYTDGHVRRFDRRERPELFTAAATLKGNKPPTHLLTSVLKDDESWCLIQPIASE